MKQMRVLIIADSLALPRDGSDGQEVVELESTYHEILKRWFDHGKLESILNAKRARTILDVDHELNNIITDENIFDCVILQIGIVDCAPRVLTIKEKNVLDKVRPNRIKRIIIKILHNHRALITKYRNIVYVSPEEFNKTYCRIIKKLKVNGIKHIAIFAIAPTNIDTSEHSPKFQIHIKKYNELLQNICLQNNTEYLDPFSEKTIDEIEKYLLNDGHHLSNTGNQLYSEKIKIFLLQRFDIS